MYLKKQRVGQNKYIHDILFLFPIYIIIYDMYVKVIYLESKRRTDIKKEMETNIGTDINRNRQAATLNTASVT